MQPLTTEIKCENLVSGYKVTFPMITFCPLSWTFFESFKSHLKNDQNFKIDHFMNNLVTEGKLVIDLARFYTGSKFIDLENLDGQLVLIST